MAEPTLSYEFKALLNKIKQETVREFPIQVISLNYLVYNILSTKTHEVTTWLYSHMISSTVNELKDMVVNKINADITMSVQVYPESVKFSKEYDELAIKISDGGKNLITSSSMFVHIVSEDADYRRFFAKNGFTIQMLSDSILLKNSPQESEDKVETNAEIVNFDSVTEEEKPEKKKRKPSSKSKKSTTKTDNDALSNYSGPLRAIPEENNIVEQNTVNMVREASKDVYGEYVNLDKTISEIFDILGKCDKNNVIIVGNRGVGKTAILERMAQLLYKQECPLQFKEKYLVRFDDTISSVIINEMNKSGKYIACVEDIEKMFLQKDYELQNMAVLKEMMKADNVCSIFTMNDAAYAKHIEGKTDFTRYLQKITVKELNEEDMFNAVKNASSKYTDYHNCVLNDETIKTSIRLAKNFITSECCPSSALNLIDGACAYTRMHVETPQELIDLREKLFNVTKEKMSISGSSDAEAFDRKDKLIREEIDLKKKIESLENKHETKKLKVTDNDIKQALSIMINVPLSELNEDEKTKLKTLKTNLTDVVIGQDDTVDVVCRAVKRQRVGLSNPNKPCVMMFVGTTGTGKSFLAKRLAHEMFGNEKNMVRLDMSEYSDKTSAAKLYGTSPGYVGYEDGGVLTEAIKKNNRCVLLLDEIEKANEEVFNVFLQVFDEGRLSDNKGTVVDFKNVIIIMTSNVGAKDVSEKRGKIGFGNTDSEEEDKEIILKSIKKQFKPEFINRIDNICYFNKLSDDNLKIIIKNEIKKVHQKVKELGYDMDESITNGKLIDSIFDKVKKESEYGARPILREIQLQLEDKLTDYIIDNSVDSGFVFKYEDIYK